MTRKQTPKRPSRTKARRGTLPLFPLLIAGVIAIGVIVVAISATGNDDSGGGGVDQTRPVTIEGEPLAPFADAGDDAALGQRPPTITGEDFAGRTVTIAADGRPKAVAFVAHWCPHCQAEVPRIEQWLEQNGLPADVGLYFVSTSANANNPNYPPSEWLAREGVSDVPTIADDDASSALRAFGAGGFPYLVYLDADNEVVLRTSGEYPADPTVYTAIFDALAKGDRPVDPRL